MDYDQQLILALKKCSDENRDKPTFTGNVIISSVCRSAADRISWLLEIIKEKDRAAEKMKCCANCQHCDETGYCLKKRAYIPDTREGIGCTEWDIWRVPEE